MFVVEVNILALKLKNESTMKTLLIILAILLLTFNLEAQTFTIINSKTSTTDGEVKPLPGTEGGKIMYVFKPK
jgi:hypothetical protein